LFCGHEISLSNYYLENLFGKKIEKKIEKRERQGMHKTHTKNK
jgi:hypothetical protein